ncbi:hypothetical protein AaE_013097 [Aphanomyces astaci]|uniref:Integrase catalytic domain-containing protein n=1 Tax=Aphanomyces astaci TaxID=112090 RepID=A0A6A4ZE01_APHAT|nr:hypothetical protein AaE_013097 [Aphanomyces astaci]
MTTVVTVKLTEHNYRSWKTYFKGRLMTKGLINTITNGTSTSDIDNQKALGILIETLDPSQYRHIDGIYDATEAYKALKTHHQPNTKIDRIEVSKEWAKLNWNPRQETLPDFLHRFDQLTIRLHEVGVHESDYNQVVKLLTLMPWDFRHIVDRLLNSASDPSMSAVKIELKAEWKAATRSGVMKHPSGQANEDRALMSHIGGRTGRGQGGRGGGRGRSGRGRGSGGPSSAKTGNCHYCGKDGHWQSECRKKNRDEGGAHTINNRDRNRGNQSQDQSTNAVYLFSAHEATIGVNGPDEEEDNPTDIIVPSLDMSWNRDIRPVRIITFQGRQMSTTFFSRRDLEIARLRNFIDYGEPKCPNWMTHPFLVTNYDMRAFHQSALRPGIEGANYQPWLDPVAYVSFPISVNNAPWEDVYRRITRTTGFSLQPPAVMFDDPSMRSQPPLRTPTPVNSTLSIFPDADEQCNTTMDTAAHASPLSRNSSLQHQIVVDSGASAHMTGNINHLHDKETCERRVVVANGKSTVATTVGKMNITLPDDKTITLSGVLLIEGMPMTLLSVPALMSSNTKVSVQFSMKGCSITLNGKTIATATLLPERRLYVLTNAQHATEYANTALINQTTLWHHRIGHLPIEALKSCAKAGLGLPPKFQDLDRPCLDCPRSKMSRVSAPKTHTRTFEPGECWHSDTKGPLPTPSVSGCQYYTVYVDDSTGYKVVRFVHSTDSATQMSNFQDIVAMSERQTGRKVKIIRTDSGPEYSSTAFDNWLTKKGIKHERSAADNQWQNGVAERTHRTLTEMALTMLNHAHMARRWWAEAVNTAAFISNRVLHTTSCTKTPIELFNGHKPTLANMRVFGCKCFNMVKAPERRNKLAPKATLCIMLGYTDNMKAYKLYDVENRRITHGVHIKFLETEFFGEPDLPEQLDEDESDNEDPNTDAILPQTTTQATPTQSFLKRPTASGTPMFKTPAPMKPSAFKSRSNSMPDPTRNYGAPLDPQRDYPFLYAPSTRARQSYKDLSNDFRKSTDKFSTSTKSHFKRLTDSQERMIERLRDGPDLTPIRSEPMAAPSPATNDIRRSNRLRKPNSKYEHFATATLDTALEGYQPDDDDEGTEENATYRIGGTEFACAAVPIHLHPIPNSHKEAMTSPEWRQWKEAEETEVTQLTKLKCWTIGTPPNDRKIIGGRWTYARKTDAEGNVIRWKARWVLKGFNQIAGVDYNESSSNVIKMTSVRAICAVATARNLVLEQADAVNAYIQAKLERPIWAVEPEGHITSPGKAALVQMALYGLNQSGHEWELHCKKQIATLGWNQSPYDPCVFTRGHGADMEMLGTYVDDFIVATPNQDKMNKIMDELSSKMNLKRQGPLHYMLGVRITRSADLRTLTMTQDAYTEKVLERFKMSSCHPVTTPEVADQEDLWHDENQPNADQGEYRAMIGSLVYLMVCTRPDIAHAVQRLSCHLHDPRGPHLIGAKRVLRYLSGTKHFGIQFGNAKPILTGYCDASWATRPDRRSTTGFCWLFLGGPLMWKSIRQRITALSSCEAEYIAAAEAARESTWLRGLMTDLGAGQDQVTLHCDNMSAIATSKSTAINERTKHIDVRHHYLRELVRSGALSLTFVPTAEMIADALTKTATKHSIQKFANWTMKDVRRLKSEQATSSHSPDQMTNQKTDTGLSSGPSNTKSTITRHQG